MAASLARAARLGPGEGPGARRYSRAHARIAAAPLARPAGSGRRPPRGRARRASARDRADRGRYAARRWALDLRKPSVDVATHRPPRRAGRGVRAGGEPRVVDPARLRRAALG